MKPPGIKIKKLFPIILICCLGIIIYSNTFQRAFHFDDDTFSKNPAIRNLSDIRSIWNYWPTRFITYLSFAVNYHFNRDAVFGYHFVNLLIHIFCAMSVWYLTLLTFSTPAMKGKDIARHADLISIFAGLIFVSHPIQTQGVTYIVQRTTSMAALFYMAALVFYAKSRLTDHGKGIYYSVSMISAILALFTKEMAVALPFAILFYDMYFLNTYRKISWKNIAPFFALMLLVPFTMFMTKSVNFLEMKRVSEYLVLPSPLNYLFTEFKVFIYYIKLLFIPLNQNLDYHYPIVKDLMEPAVIGGSFLILAVLFFAIKTFRNYRMISFSVFFFFLVLLPESSVIPIADVIFEHRLYLPMAGFGIFVSCGAYYILGRKSVKLMAAALTLLVLSYSSLAYNRNFVWKDEISLWNDVVKKSPNKARPNYNLGVAYFSKGDLDDAAAFFTRAIELNPVYVEAYNNRGLLYAKRGDLDKAIADFDRAIAIKPDNAEAYNNRGLSYAGKRDFSHAISDFDRAIALKPAYSEAYGNRGVAYASKNNIEEAIADLTKAIRLNPEYAANYSNRAVIYFYKNEYKKAQDDINRAEALGFKVNQALKEKLRQKSSLHTTGN